MWHEAESRRPLGLIVILSRDTALTNRLSDALLAFEPDIELQFVRDLEVLMMRLSSLRADVVLLDVADLNMQETCLAISKPPLSCLPVIVFQEKGNDVLRVQALSAGAAAYIDGSLPHNIDDALINAWRSTKRALWGAEEQRHYEDIIEASSDGIFV